MTYKDDKNEFIAFVHAGISGQPAENAAVCINRVTKKTEDAFRNERAACYLEALKQDGALQEAFAELSALCNADVQDCAACPVCKYCNTYIENTRKNADRQAPRLVDLFCGAGGLSLGFVQEGFAVSLANDIEECCVDTYAHNHPEVPESHIIRGDIHDVAGELDDLLADRRVDIVIGGPPCQGFSMANRQRLIDDPRNHLYKTFVEVVGKLHPAFFVMENVKGMQSVAEQVKDDFRNIGYTVECQVLNAKDFGVPQNRERLIYIGNRKGIDNKKIFKEINKAGSALPGYRLADALYGLRSLEASRVKNATETGSQASGYKIEKNTFSGTNDYIDYINQGKRIPVVLNHKARYNNDRDIEIFGRMEQGDRSDDPKIADIMPYARRNDIFKDKYFKLENDKICKTITAHMKFDCNMYIHPTQARGLTPREAARVQSYPDDYFFRGAYTKTYMQIGNSVPPLLGRAIAGVLKRYMNTV
ncbi:DNA (cytosine-5-)-methyltransferase [Marvinbryantia formatexigens DSM 14469]|uniref:Cytosine-specific methyltransferase n=1 Tax=Marvinbryantia formatexigens DSM 14469 TaxID=478749 RepID=C6L9J5_9FIRM|nr:DNA cytosine methyltransferase [Marvinbryantia formatexigens]EET62934.1 DNA (cytosine-5-)-methyltransferase [Marvinbryantia formatexigens DSM 14469]UWO23521.1 DNA cytosine methyltransferase [Marvinbryantia formatexigens DSM 14469]SDG55476.1 DNA (cytosine-5)-methyltransferase 1 [Marvinbryantia formatexigens]